MTACSSPAGAFEVVDELPSAPQEAIVFRPLHGLSDQAADLVHRSAEQKLVIGKLRALAAAE